MAYNLDVFQRQLADLQSQLQNFQQPQQSNYQPNYFTPPQPPAPAPAHQVQYVEGMAGAQKYQLEKLQPNSSEVIMDKNENIFYHVSKDANGTPSSRIPVGRFTIEESFMQDSIPLTRKDFDDFKDEIRQLFTNMKPSAPTHTSAAAPKKEAVA